MLRTINGPDSPPSHHAPYLSPVTQIQPQSNPVQKRSRCQEGIRCLPCSLRSRPPAMLPLGCETARMLGWTMTSYPSPRIVALGRMALISGSGLPGVGYLHGSGDYKVL